MHRAIWSGVDQYLVPVFLFTFMRILPRTACVNLSDIISEVGGLMDCGSNEKRKSGGPDINIPCQFSVCLLVTCERAPQERLAYAHSSFPSFFSVVSSPFVLRPPSSISERIKLKQKNGAALHNPLHISQLWYVRALVSLHGERRK